jgi:CDP-4-dehydro-6-deoxyglucose reductase
MGDGRESAGPAVTTLRVAAADVTVVLRAGETMLAALARHGYSHRFGCRRGGCGACKVTLVSGRAHYAAVVCDQVLSGAEQDAGVWLSCRAVPITDVVIGLDLDDRLKCFAPMLAALAQKARLKEHSE